MSVCVNVCLKGMNTCMCTMNLKFSIPYKHSGVLVRDLSSYSIQHLRKLLKAASDQTDNTALSYCIMKKKHRNIGHTNPPHVWSACVLLWLQTDPETNVTFANMNPTCRGERVSPRSLCGAELEMHEQYDCLRAAQLLSRGGKLDSPLGALHSGRWWWQNLGQSQRRQRGPGGDREQLLVNYCTLSYYCSGSQSFLNYGTDS